MKESATYQAILEEGRVLEAKLILLRQGRKRFGPPPRALERKLEAIEDLQMLDKMLDRLLVASSWHEFFGD
jgi:Smoothelin cytoskeleton protein